MMVLLISHLSENPDLEVHVFLPRNGDWIREDDVIVNALREAAQHWHQVKSMNHKEVMVESRIPKKLRNIRETVWDALRAPPKIL